MTQTESDESGGEIMDTGYTKRFVTTPQNESSEPSDGESAETPAPRMVEGQLMSRRAAISGVGMGAAALLCFFIGANLSGNEAGVSQATADKVFELRDQVSDTQAKADALPEAKDADRGLVTAQTSAEEITGLQNEYRHLTPAVAAAGGRLDAGSAEPIQRGLTPYFAPSVEQSSLAPWYLLASDKDASAGTGLPMSFDSGFSWVTQRPYLISGDSTVKVTWLAVATHAGKGETPAVLAWTRADYDLRRKTFVDVETGTTTTGETLQQEVKDR